MITIDSLTTGELTGAGAYDALMRASKAHLDQEYTLGRIVGADYATVYLGMLSPNLQAATSFVLQQELNNIEVSIKEATLLNISKQGLLLDEQIAQAVVQTALLNHELATLRPKQTIQLDNQNALLVSQEANQVKQNALLDEQILGQVAQNLVTSKQGELLDEQIKSEITNTVNATGGLAKANLDKANSEISILNQKKITETAQTVGTTSTVGGLVGKEMLLKEEQAQSFLRDAEQKAAKFYSDMLSVAYSTAPSDHDIAAWGFSPTNSNAVLSKLVQGVDATFTP